MKMRVSIIDAKEVVYEKIAQKAILPAYEGETCILDFHQPFLYRLRKGTIRIDDSFTIFIKDGIARMMKNELVLMVER